VARHDVVSNAHATILSSCCTRTSRIPGPYPFGRDIQVEGGSDRTRLKGKRATADSGAIFDLNSNALRPAT
jgi:hypothetical protein